jgi:hypothetical protein
LRTFARIAEQWKLSARDAMALLGVDSRSTYYELLKRARGSKEVKGLSKDQLDRLSYLLGVYEAVVLFRTARVAIPVVRRIRRPLRELPLEVMRSSMIGLYQTFAHLATARGW